MRFLLFMMGVILLIRWSLGVFVYKTTGNIHILIALGLFSVLVGIIKRS